MVNIGCVTGSTAAHVLTQASIPADSLVVGFSLASYSGSHLGLAYAYKV